MKILLIANCAKIGGGISVQVQILKENLESEGKSVSLFNTKKNTFRRILYMPFQLIYEGWKKEIFHIHGCSFAGFFPIILGVLIGRLLQKKVVITYHGGNASEFFAKYPGLIKFFFKRADKIIVLSSFLSEEFRKYGLDTEVLPNIFNVKSTFFIERKNFAPKLITTRALKDIYDIKTAVTALSIIQEKYPQASLHIVGTGSGEAELKKMVQQKDIKNVVFTGFVANKDIYEYLKLADFWCNPTTQDNMPMSLLEAINAGLVIVSTNVGGIPYMVEHCKSAWLVNKGDSGEMASGVLHLVENHGLAQTLIANARKTLQKYEWKNIKGKLFLIYQN